MSYGHLQLQANGMIMSVLFHSLIDIDRCMLFQAIVDSFLISGPFLITMRNENLTGLYFPGKHTMWYRKLLDFSTHRKPW